MALIHLALLILSSHLTFGIDPIGFIKDDVFCIGLYAHTDDTNWSSEIYWREWTYVWCSRGLDA